MKMSYLPALLKSRLVTKAKLRIEVRWQLKTTITKLKIDNILFEGASKLQGFISLLLIKRKLMPKDVFLDQMRVIIYLLQIKRKWISVSKHVFANQIGVVICVLQIRRKKISIQKGVFFARWESANTYDLCFDLFDNEICLVLGFNGNC